MKEKEITGFHELANNVPISKRFYLLEKFQAFISWLTIYTSAREFTFWRHLNNDLGCKSVEVREVHHVMGPKLLLQMPQQSAYAVGILQQD